jgi:hypothetical protein
MQPRDVFEDTSFQHGFEIVKLLTTLNGIKYKYKDRKIRQRGDVGAII